MVNSLKIVYRLFARSLRVATTMWSRVEHYLRVLFFHHYKGYILGADCRVAKNLCLDGIGVSIGDSSSIGENVTIEAETIHIGDNVVIEPNCHLSGVKHLLIDDFSYISEGLFVDGDGQYDLTIKENVWIGRNSHINVRRDVDIGNNVGIGEATQIWTHGYFAEIVSGYPHSFGTVVLEDGVWSCPGVIYLPGVAVGHHAIVTTGAVVSKSLAPASLYAGVPAAMKSAEDKYRRLLTEDQQLEMIVKRLKDRLDLNLVGSDLYEVKTRAIKDSHKFFLLLATVVSQAQVNKALTLSEQQEIIILSPNISEEDRDVLLTQSAVSLFDISSKTYTKKGFQAEVVIKKCLGEYHIRFTRAE